MAINENKKNNPNKIRIICSISTLKFSVKTYPIYTIKKMHCRGGQAKADATFGAGAGVIWLDDVECRGNETSLLECSSRPWGEHNCGHTEDAGVICEGKYIIHFSF